MPCRGLAPFPPGPMAAWRHYSWRRRVRRPAEKVPVPFLRLTNRAEIMMMTNGRAGLWLIGAYGGVGTTVAVGLSALARGIAGSTGLVTALPAFERCGLANPADLVIGGHELRQTSYVEAADTLGLKGGSFAADLLKACRDDLTNASAAIRPGHAIGAGKCIEEMADWPGTTRRESCRATIARLQKDWSDFRAAHDLAQIVVINVASTEPLCPP